MDGSVKLTLPWPPSVNQYKNIGRMTRTKSGQVYQQRVNSPATKQFYWEVWTKIRAAMATEGVKSFDSDEIRLSLCIDMHPPDNRRRDIDNYLKVLIDSLVRGGLIKDDSFIDRLLVRRQATMPHGQVIITIEELIK